MERQAFDFRGIHPPLITPLTGDGEVDTGSLRRLVRHVVDGGAHGLWVLGATGQFFTLTERQRDEVTACAMEAAAGDVPVVVGCIDSGPDRSVERARRARAAGAQAVFATAPIYDPVTQTEVLAYFRRLRDGIDLPLIAYEAAYATQTPIAVDTIRTLAEEGTIVGLKHSADPTVLRHVIAATRHLPAFRIVTGNAFLVDAALLAGAHGAVPTVANIAPRLYARLHAAAAEGAWEQAATLQEEALRLDDLVAAWDPHGSVFGNFLAMAKWALHEMGVIDDPSPGIPYPDGGPEQRARVTRGLAALGYLPVHGPTAGAPAG